MNCQFHAFTDLCAGKGPMEGPLGLIELGSWVGPIASWMLQGKEKSLVFYQELNQNFSLQPVT